MGEPMVIVKGQVMTLSQYQAMVNDAVSTYTQEMTVAIEQLSGLQDQLYGHSGSVSNALSTLQADMHGIDGAIGTDEQGQKFRTAWNNAWSGKNNLQDGFTGLAKALISIGDGMGSAADTVFQAEEQNLASFDNMNMGFHFTATDPRVQDAPRPVRGPF